MSCCRLGGLKQTCLVTEDTPAELPPQVLRQQVSVDELVQRPEVGLAQEADLGLHPVIHKHLQHAPDRGKDEGDVDQEHARHQLLQGQPGWCQSVLVACPTYSHAEPAHRSVLIGKRAQLVTAKWDQKRHVDCLLGSQGHVGILTALRITG